MPIAARWRPLATLPPPRGRDAMPGIYELADADRRTIYVGQSARDVPNRIRQHLARSSCIADGAAYWRYAYSRVPQADEADHLARHRSRNGELPPCNEATPRPRGVQRRASERFRSDG